MIPSQQLVDHLFRHESGKMIAVLTRIFGIHQLQLAEDVTQEAFLKAMQTWKFNQVPDNPSAWLMRVAKNKAVDILRHNKKILLNDVEAQDLSRPMDQFFAEGEIQDSQLRMIFACCHPSLKEEDQIAITLKTTSAFSTREIAKALVSNEDTIQKRLTRARQYIRDHRIQFEIPAGSELAPRLETVNSVLYLIFNEGYNSSKNDELIRRDLCVEAMRLCKLVTEHQSVKNPESHALMALMCLHAARFESRTDEHGIVLLENQDRSKWSKDLIDIGYFYLNQSAEGEHLSVYHIESALAAEHCRAPSFEKTDWNRILKLYDLLYTYKPSPTVQLNRAVAMAQLGMIEKAIDLVMSIDKIKGLLANQYMYSAVLGEFYKRLSNAVRAKEYFQQAYNLTTSEVEKKLLEQKLQHLSRMN